MPEIIVVTGVTRGLGRALVPGLVEQGHTVVGCGRSDKALAKLRRQFDRPHRFDAVDVADDEHVAAWASQVLASTGTPDRIVNNAALINASRVLWNVPAEEFGQVIDVNIKGVFHVIRHFLPAMLERGSGVVINLSSGWGRSTAPEVAPYCASKWAVEGLTRALAQELPDSMAAVPLNPGIIHTEMLESCFGGSAAGYPSPEEWAARAVPFLLSIGPEQNGEPLTVN